MPPLAGEWAIDVLSSEFGCVCRAAVECVDRRSRRPTIWGGVPIFGTNSKIQQCTDILNKQPKPQMAKKKNKESSNASLAMRACACAEAQAITRRHAERPHDED